VPGFFFGRTDGDESHIYVLRARTYFRRYRARPFPFSCFTLPDVFLAVPSASGPVLRFCAPCLIFGGPEGDGFRFHVLYRGRPVPFSCFGLPDSFSEVPSAFDPVFVFCVPGLVFSYTDGVRSLFMFSAIPRASGPVFMFCAPRHVFGGAECVESRFHVLSSDSFSAVPRATSLIFIFRRYRGCQIMFSCFAHPDTFSAVPRASCPIFMFCAPRLVSHGTEGVRSHFKVLRSLTRFRRYRGR
jgi:hypothetical protein